MTYNPARCKMSKIDLDLKKCSKCGLCIKDCPAGVMATGSGGFPEIPESRKPFCIRCGHCEAVCPTSALTILFRPAEKTGEEPKASALPPAQLEAFLRSRRSIRNYKSDTVPRDELDAVFGALKHSPTGGNSQGIKWLVVNGKEEVRKFTGIAVDWMKFIKENDPEAKLKFSADNFIKAHEKGEDLFCRNAPHLAINYYSALNGSGATDAIIAMTQFELLLSSRGIGSCWGGFFIMAIKSWKPLQTALELPEDFNAGYAMMFGYPSFPYHSVPRRKMVQVRYFPER